jgi:tetratricopeptide (TPR) repeat protein
MPSGLAAVVQLPALQLPFVRPEARRLPDGPLLVRVDDLDLAFPNKQKRGTRLVLTQSTYLVQKWIDKAGPSGWIIATASRENLRGGAPEALEQRGPWRHFEILDLDRTGPAGLSATQSAMPMNSAEIALAREKETQLADAFRSSSGSERLRICRELVEATPGSEVATLAFASACREQQELAEARTALERAAELAPEWEAVHFEAGKFWLACEEMDLARAAFQRAADRMPAFSAAYSNLGATLGELYRPELALEAFAHALKGDPDNLTLLNNVGVVSRELGRLDESEAALTRLVGMSPSFVFGHYNLGHTRLLRGDYKGALTAYEEGQRRDPQKNRRQGCRLAVVRFANGDMDGAEQDLFRLAEEAPPEEREDLLLEAFEIVQAVLQARPELAANSRFLGQIRAKIKNG